MKEVRNEEMDFDDILRLKLIVEEWKCGDTPSPGKVRLIHFDCEKLAEFSSHEKFTFFFKFIQNLFYFKLENERVSAFGLKVKIC